jgi:hypothetical protein
MIGTPAPGYTGLQIASLIMAIASCFLAAGVYKHKPEIRAWLYPPMAVLFDVIAFYIAVIVDHYTNFFAVDFSYWSSILRFHTIATFCLELGIFYVIYVAFKDKG